MSIISKVKTTASDIWAWLFAPRWHVVVLCLDKIDEVDKAHIPMKEVARFLRASSHFYLKVTFITFNDPHRYGGPFDGKYILHWPELPTKWVDQIPDCNAVVALYKLNGRPPLQLGSTWALAQGIPIRGKLRIFTSIPTDIEDYYNNQPYQGFTCRSGQICAHEINNGIRGTVEVAPYFCTTTNVQDGLPAWEYETQRVRLEDSCYKTLGSNTN